MIGNQLTLIDCTSNQAYNHGRLRYKSVHYTIMSQVFCYYAGMVGKLQTVVQVKNQAYNVLSANHSKQVAYT